MTQSDKRVHFFAKLGLERMYHTRVQSSVKSEKKNTFSLWTDYSYGTFVGYLLDTNSSSVASHLDLLRLNCPSLFLVVDR